MAKHGHHKGKMGKVMHEFKERTLHSGSQRGPKVRSRKQAIAIGLSEARKAGENVAPPRRQRGTAGLAQRARLGRR